MRLPTPGAASIRLLPNPASPTPYSSRSAWIGSVALTRRAGIDVEIIDTSTSTAATEISVAPSVTSTPKSAERMTFALSATAAVVDRGS